MIFETIRRMWYYLLFKPEIEEFNAKKREAQKQDPPFFEASQFSEVDEND